MRCHRDHLRDGERKIHAPLVLLFLRVVFSHLPVAARRNTFCLRGIAAQQEVKGSDGRYNSSTSWAGQETPNPSVGHIF